MKLDGFKKFIHKGGSYIPKVCIRKNGQMSFNAGAVNKFDLDVFKFVMVYISEDKKRIAIKFTNNDKESGLHAIQKRPGNFAFSAISFLRLNDIPFKETINFDFLWDDKDKIAIFRPFNDIDIIKNKLLLDIDKKNEKGE